MPMNTVSTVHFARPLENLLLDYRPVGLIGEQIFPVIPVVHENDKYYVFNRGDKFRRTDDARPDGVRAKQLDFGFTTDGYVTTERAFEVLLTDRERRNADDQLKLEVTRVRGAQDILMLNQEVRIATLMADTNQFSSANQTNVGAVATNQWNNASFTGSIESVIDGAKEAIRTQLGGLMATHLVVPKAVAVVMKRDAKIRDLIKYTHSDLVTDGDLPSKLWGCNVFVPAATYNNASEGVADSMTDVWGKHVWLLYRTEGPAMGTVSYGYIFRVGSLQVKTWREEEVDTTFFRPFYNQTEKVVSKFAGYWMQGVIS